MSGSGSLRSAIGDAIRRARLERDWTQAELATRAGVSRGLVSAVERGRVEASLESIEHLADALDARLVIDLHLPLVIGHEDQRDAAHARCVAAVRRALERLGYVCVVEQPFEDGRRAGWIDLLAYSPASRRLIVVEIKTQLRDLGGLQRQVGWYARNAHRVGRHLGWTIGAVDCLVVFLATDENDAALAANERAIRASFPVRGRALRAGLEPGRRLGGWALAMVDPRRRGERTWVALRLDGRRVGAPYRSYADFMRTIRGGPSAGVAAAPRRASRSCVTRRSTHDLSPESAVPATTPARTSM